MIRSRQWTVSPAPDSVQSTPIAVLVRWTSWVYGLIAVGLAVGVGVGRPLGCDDTVHARNQQPASASAAVASSDRVQAGAVTPETLWRDFVQRPNTHPQIPNVSAAGLERGPFVPEAVFAVRDAPYGAHGDGIHDDTDAIVRAIDDASGAGGVVELGVGVYRVTEPLFLHGDRVVLRGQGPGRTTLRFERPLEEALAPACRSADATTPRWSWHGGLVWIAPRGVANSCSEASRSGWLHGPRLGTVLGEPRRGARRFRVRARRTISADEWIIVRVQEGADFSLAKSLAGDGRFAKEYPWNRQTSGKLVPTKVLWPARVVAVRGNEIEIKQPLRFDLRRRWKPTVYGMGPIVQHSGIQGLTLQLARSRPWTRDTHRREQGWNGVFFQNAINCWLRDVQILNAENGVIISASKHLSVSDFSLAATEARLQPHHHDTLVRAYSSDILLEGFLVETKPFHGASIEGYSMGNVWSRGQMHHGTFDAHKRLPYENVRTEIEIFNDGHTGGSKGAGPPMGARFVSWNVAVLNREPASICEADMMPLGALVAVTGCAGSPVTRSEAVVTSGDRVLPHRLRNLFHAQKTIRGQSR